VANGPVHRLAGAAAGAVAAGYRCGDVPGCRQVLEATGGAVGGYWGGQMPDLLEPAISSWHRDVAHSWSAGALALKGMECFGAWEASCRRRSLHYNTLRNAATDHVSAIWYWLLEIVWQLAAGLAAGFLAGYISHVALDALTPRGLPLIARGVA